MTESALKAGNRGSVWRRWEPHIHTPGTVLEDRFPKDKGWELYLDALEAVTPRLQAIGVTDYCITRSYERMREEKAKGRLKDCEVLFPNVELRLKIGTAKGNFVNIHLLVSPEDPNHVEELNRFLGRLSFTAYDDEFTCAPSDLARLGQRAHHGELVRSRPGSAWQNRSLRAPPRSAWIVVSASVCRPETALRGVRGDKELTGGWWRTTVRFEALERFLPSFRGPHVSAGFRVSGAAMTYIAYLDEFGPIGPCIARDDPRHNDSPVFGLAGFIMPLEVVRGFGTWFYQRKCDLLDFEIQRSGEHPAVWEKKGSSVLSRKYLRL